MPNIGKPNFKNNFKDIKMAPKESTQQMNARSRSDILNDVAGNRGAKDGIQFVDGKKHNQMGKNDFMKLLAHQLANQDPSNPMDQKKFAAELAQFSSLEQLANINSKLKSMDQNAPSEGKFYGASFLGRQVMTKGTSLKFDGENSVDAPFTLEKSAKNLMVRVYDTKGQMVAQINEENFGKGPQVISWDGHMQDGTTAAKGDYAFEVFAWDKNYTPFKGETKTSGIVTAVNFKNGETVFEVDGKKTVFLRDVETFRLLDHNSKAVSADPALPGAPKQPANNGKQAANQYNNVQEMGY